MEEVTIQNLNAKKIRLKFGNQDIIAVSKEINTPYVGTNKFRIRAVIKGDKKEYLYFERLEIPLERISKARIKSDCSDWFEGSLIKPFKPLNLAASAVDKLTSPKIQAEIYEPPKIPSNLSTESYDVLNHPRTVEVSIEEK